jgi:hypothetical protein
VARDEAHYEAETKFEQARLDTNRPRIFTNKRIPAPSIRAFATPFVDGGSEQNIIRRQPTHIHPNFTFTSPKSDDLTAESASQITIAAFGGGRVGAKVLPRPHDQAYLEAETKIEAAVI